MFVVKRIKNDYSIKIPNLSNSTRFRRQVCTGCCHCHYAVNWAVFCSKVDAVVGRLVEAISCCLGKTWGSIARSTGTNPANAFHVPGPYLKLCVEGFCDRIRRAPGATLIRGFPFILQPISLSQSLVISRITLVMRSYQNSSINLSDGPGPLPRPHCSNALQLHVAPIPECTLQFPPAI